MINQLPGNVYNMDGQWYLFDRAWAFNSVTIIFVFVEALTLVY